MTYNLSPQVGQFLQPYNAPHMLHTNALHSGCKSAHIPTHLPYTFYHNHHGLSHNHHANALHSGCKPAHIPNIQVNKHCLADQTANKCPIDYIPTHLPYTFCHNHHGLSHNHHGLSHNHHGLLHNHHGLFHDHHDDDLCCSSHDAAWVNSHDAGNTLVLNMCATPHCHWGVGGTVGGVGGTVGVGGKAITEGKEAINPSVPEVNKGASDAVSYNVHNLDTI